MPSLAAELRSRSEASAVDRPPAVSGAYEAAIRAVADAGIPDAALRVGERAPDFVLPDQDGRPVSLQDLRAEGPVILCFYRGSWCPYCNLELRAYHAQLPDLRAAGIGFVAIGPELPDHTRAMVHREELTFPVLSDLGCHVAASFRVVHEVAPDVVEIYREKGHDLAVRHGEPDSPVRLPLPATFLIDREGLVRFSFADADYTLRAEPTEVIAIARGL